MLFKFLTKSNKGLLFSIYFLTAAKSFAGIFLPSVSVIEYPKLSHIYNLTACSFVKPVLFTLLNFILLPCSSFTCLIDFLIILYCCIAACFAPSNLNIA